jgi:CubicO group peptidase (beta-lactamase class C family)
VRRLLAGLIGVTLLSCGGPRLPEGAPQPTASPTTTSTAEALASFALHNRFSGSVLVARQGQTVLRSGFGMADRENGTSNTPETRFQIGSLSKQFTAMAVLMLEERGQLQLTDPICAHLVDCPVNWQQVTVEQLLNHTSGIANYPDEQPGHANRVIYPITPQMQVTEAGKLPLKQQPGSDWHYCNVCYVALGLAVEKESGQSLSEFLQHRIFDVLAMRDTGVNDGQTIPYLALDYIATFGVQRAPLLDLGWAYAAGQMYSTVDDLYRWDQALYSNELLREPLTPRLQAAAIPALGGRYAYGWALDNAQGRSRVGHAGAIGGFRSWIGRFPEARSTVIVLTNLGGAPALATAGEGHFSDHVFDQLSVLAIGRAPIWWRATTSASDWTPEPAAATRTPVAPVGTILLADDMQDAARGVLSTGSDAIGRFRGYAAGHFVISVPAMALEPGGLANEAYSLVSSRYADVSVMADVQLSNPAGDQYVYVACRSQGASAQYRLVVFPASGLFEIVRWASVEARSVSLSGGLRPTAALRTGAELNRLELICRGRTIEARINNGRVASLNDSALDGGAVLIGVGQAAPGRGPGRPTREGSAEARFTRLVVTQR